HILASRNRAEGGQQQHRRAVSLRPLALRSGVLSPGIERLIGDLDRTPLPLPVEDAAFPDAGCRHRGSLATRRAETRELHGAAVESEAKPAPEILCGLRDPCVLGLDYRAAAPAHEHLAGMRVIRHCAGDEAIGAFDA